MEKRFIFLYYMFCLVLVCITCSYGDKAPQTVLGKLLGFVWMLAGLIIVTMFISMITSAMTSVSLSGTSSIRGVTVS